MGAIFLLRASELKNKEVINLSNNEKIGFVSDFEICTTNGEISAIFVPNKNKFFSFLCSRFRRNFVYFHENSQNVHFLLTKF